MTGTVAVALQKDKDARAAGKTGATSSPHVEFADPADTEPVTSSDVEEEHLEKIWANGGNIRRLSVDALSSQQSQERSGKRRRGNGPRPTVSTPNLEWKC